MTAAVGPVPSGQVQPTLEVRDIGPAQSRWGEVLRSKRIVIGGGILLFMVAICLVTLIWTVRYSTVESDAMARHGPNFKSGWGWFGYDTLGRSILARSLFGGTISLAVGLAAATISVVLGVAVGLLAGYRGGWVDAGLMRVVDILYGLPYVLLVILFKVAFERPLEDGVTWRTCFGLVFMIGTLATFFSTTGKAQGNRLLLFGLSFLLLLATVFCFWPEPAQPSVKTAKAPVPATTQSVAATQSAEAPKAVPATQSSSATPVATVPPATRRAVAFKLSAQSANLVVLFSAIGLVSWLTMARVVRGQVLSLRGQPFIEACRAMGVREGRIFLRHILPNLIGPITVYATLTVPSAILQESFLSFLGVGVNPPLATWGSLASEGVEKLSPLKFYWWLLVFPCTLLAITLLSLNFLGDGLRDVFDPKKEAAKI